MKPILIYVVQATCLGGALLWMSLPAAAAGDPEAGARVFGVCAACHSLESGRHMTGPSLFGVPGRQAGSAEGFDRYSKAMRESELVWDADTLDAFLADPQGLIPGNRMQFGGIEDSGTRADLIAFLEQAASERESAEARSPPGGMMRGPGLVDLKELGREQQIASIRYCGNSYHVTTEAGRTFPFWEFNLRFKTDSSDMGPRAGQPVIIGGGMRGDRAFVVFARPSEIARFIEERCD